MGGGARVSLSAAFDGLFSFPKEGSFGGGGDCLLTQ